MATPAAVDLSSRTSPKNCSALLNVENTKIIVEKYTIGSNMMHQNRPRCIRLVRRSYFHVRSAPLAKKIHKNSIVKYSIDRRMRFATLSASVFSRSLKQRNYLLTGQSTVNFRRRCMRRSIKCVARILPQTFAKAKLAISESWEYYILKLLILSILSPF